MACETCIIYIFMLRLAAYFIVLALLLLSTFIAFKFLGEWRGRQAQEERVDENSPLMLDNKEVNISYGACVHDLESQTRSTNTNSNSSNGKGSTLYDSKICVICYDEQRNCFFVPCGHCATCFLCAQRIFYEEKRNCPVCRRLIGKITRWFHY